MFYIVAKMLILLLKGFPSLIDPLQSSFLCHFFMIVFQTAQDVVDVIDNVMKMKRENLRESQRANKASSKYEILQSSYF